MHFPKIQHDRILEVIRQNNIDLADFYLVKRKGWIRIEHASSNHFFTYFKKKETRINPDSKEWEHGIFFRIKTNNTSETIEPTFDSMMLVFDSWIKKLN